MEKCVYCTNIPEEKEFIMYDQGEGNAGIQIGIFNNHLDLSIRLLEHGFAIYTEIEYCPMCGKKLKNE